MELVKLPSTLRRKHCEGFYEARGCTSQMQNHRINKNAFLWDAYHPLMTVGGCIPACTGQGVSAEWVSARGGFCPGVPAWGVSAWGFLPGGCLPGGVSAQGGVCHTKGRHVDKQTPVKT